MSKVLCLTIEQTAVLGPCNIKGSRINVGWGPYQWNVRANALPAGSKIRKLSKNELAL